MDLVDDQTGDLGQRGAQRACPAHRLELFRRRHPQVGAAGPFDVGDVLAGEPFDVQSERPPGGQLPVQLVGQRPLRHQPRRLASVTENRPQRRQHADHGLAGAGGRHDQQVPVGEKVRRRRDLGRVQPRPGQVTSPVRGDEPGRVHGRPGRVERAVVAVPRQLERVPRGLGRGAGTRARSMPGGIRHRQQTGDHLHRPEPAVRADRGDRLVLDEMADPPVRHTGRTEPGGQRIELGRVGQQHPRVDAGGTVRSGRPRVGDLVPLQEPALGDLRRGRERGRALAGIKQRGGQRPGTGGITHRHRYPAELHSAAPAGRASSRRPGCRRLPRRHPRHRLFRRAGGDRLGPPGPAQLRILPDAQISEGVGRRATRAHQRHAGHGAAPVVVSLPQTVQSSRAVRTAAGRRLHVGPARIAEPGPGQRRIHSPTRQRDLAHARASRRRILRAPRQIHQSTLLRRQTQPASARTDDRLPVADGDHDLTNRSNPPRIVRPWRGTNRKTAVGTHH